MRILIVSLALLSSACGWINFGRAVPDEELRARADVRSYYDEMAQAFASGNAEALARLFDPAIAKPMTREKILAWGQDFFGRHGPARFKIERVEFERLGLQNAIVTLTYRVETRDGEGSFAATERDELVKRGRRWYVTGWEAVAAPAAAP
ncbi:MAG: hypothetical protein HYZ74_09600 [Elusimicrobia bacterium]|nr:hypothetical protein [Elusimicrobiota bacterium]